MPITEVPTNQAPPEPPRKGSRNFRYDDFNTTDLLHAIDDLEQANSWGRVREMIWISIIIHLLVLWYIVYGQKYIHLPAVHVVTEQQQLKQHPKQLTYLQLPKDLLKQPKPKHTNRISNQNRIAEAPHPIQKPKTAAQIEAMRRAGRQMHAPPAPHRKPAPTQRPRPQMRRGQQAQKPQPHPQQSAPRPRTPPAQPLPSSNLSKLMAPQPHRVQNFRKSPVSPGQQIQQALRAASQGGFNGAGAQSGDNGLNAPVQHQGIQGSVNILSNTMGVNFSHYLQMVIAATKRAWYPIIPEEARPPINKSGIVEIRFTINADGNVTGMQLYGPSGDVALDRAAWGGITGATPFPPLPKQFIKNGGKHLSLQFNFLYNENPDQ
jgi:TonB family protein